jgi:hypothetical protein
VAGEKNKLKVKEQIMATLHVSQAQQKEKHNSCEMRWKSTHVAKIRGNKGTGALFFARMGFSLYATHVH